MITYEIVTKIPRGKFVWGCPFYEDKLESLSDFQSTLALKPYEQAVEVSIGDRHIIAVRLGKRGESTRKSRETAGAMLLKKVSESIDEVMILDLREIGLEGLDLLTGIVLAGWRFDKYRTSLRPGEKPSLKKVLVLCSDLKEFQRRADRLAATVAGVLCARELTSEPPNVLYPMAYANRLKELSSLGIGIEILDEKALLKAGMTALVASGKGGGHPPCAAILTWNGLNKKSKPIALAGKGVCFDSGGLCIKPNAQQYEMKWDNAAAGVVVGVIKALALAKAPVHVVGIVGLIENMPDGHAMRPGDVINTMSGQTVEIINTDAEGRLVLCDCMWYVQEKYSPKVLIDLGTLTMETFSSLGNAYGGLYSNDADLARQLKEAGLRSGDLVWELPMGGYFAKQIESQVADMRNLGVEFCGENGACAEFLRRFVKNIPWGHFDIGGVSWTKEGVTGFGVRLLEEWILQA